METVVWVVHVGAALGIIGLVLMQHGKGADMGAAFGSGSAGGGIWRIGRIELPQSQHSHTGCGVFLHQHAADLVFGAR